MQLLHGTLCLLDSAVIAALKGGLLGELLRGQTADRSFYIFCHVMQTPENIVHDEFLVKMHGSEQECNFLTAK